MSVAPFLGFTPRGETLGLVRCKAAGVALAFFFEMAGVVFADALGHFGGQVVSVTHQSTCSQMK
jgi:hypothetical protein